MTPCARGALGQLLDASRGRRGVLEARAVEVGRGQPDQRARDGEQGLADVGVVAAGYHEAVEEQADENGTDDRSDERTDDAAPIAVGQEHPEVPGRDAHHDPDENAHRLLPCFLRRLFAAARLRSASAFSSAVPPPSAVLPWAASRAARRASW